uniref:RING-type E3 ubiquitin transferase n=1 Tax=Anopheles epiroticus TaxID=199890 RepID=A0A182P509_9DIPT
MDALVENAAAPPSRFYCHSCAIEIDRVSSEFTCPHCLEGFIEELPAADRSGAAESAASGQDAEQPSNVFDSQQISNEARFLNHDAIRLAGEIFTNSFLSPFLRRNGGQEGGSAGAGGTDSGDQGLFAVDDIPMDGSSGPSSGASGTGDMGEGSASSSTGASGGSGDSRSSMRFAGRRGSRRRGVQNINHVDQILREILISVSGNGNGAGTNGPMFFMGNPGDYAWGREGIDTIVTQLLNQMDNTGPPPLEKERIAEIPTVTINEEQVERKLQCSVCFEDFVVGESVRKLPCLHVYHEPCIIPWLELHGTCPICRNSLSPEDSRTGGQDSSQSPSESSQPNSQQHQPAGPQSDSSGRQNSNFLTFTIRPGMTNLLFDMGPPLASPAPPPSSSSVSSSLASGSGSGTGNTAGPGNGTQQDSTGASGSSTGGGNGAANNSQRDEDGTIDNTLELD